jgi:hypothetical protein
VGKTTKDKQMSKKRRSGFGLFTDEELNELETDNFGRVITDKDLIQIQIRGNIKNDIVCIGTITFHENKNDYIRVSITGSNLEQKLIDIWEHTGISKFILKKWGGKLFYHIDLYYYLENNFKDQVNNYDNLVYYYPEYDLFKFTI